MLHVFSRVPRWHDEPGGRGAVHWCEAAARPCGWASVSCELTQPFEKVTRAGALA